MIDPGLCGTCQHMKQTETKRGSSFYLCLLSRTDRSFRKYPALPVNHCQGYKSLPKTPPTVILGNHCPEPP